MPIFRCINLKNICGGVNTYKMVSKCSAQVKINPITKLNLDFTLCDEVLPSKMTSIKNVDLFYTHSRK